MTTVNQSAFAKLLTAADKLLPTKTALRAAGLLPKERKFISGEGWRFIETVPSYFQGITLEAHRAGFISASVHAVDGKTITYQSVPFTMKANVIVPFRVTVYADTLLPLVKLYNKTDMLALSISEANRFEMRVGRSVDRLNLIQWDMFYVDAYAAMMKPAPIVEVVTVVPAPICTVCNTCPAPQYNYSGKPVCANCYHNIQAYASRVQTRAERLYARSEKVAQEAAADQERAHQMASVIPFGQPILVGHHSEAADRRYRDRIWNTFQRGFEKYQKAAQLERSAKASENHRAISSDDPAAVLKLEAKLAQLIQNQEFMKAVNKHLRSIAKLTTDEQTVSIMETFSLAEKTARAILDKPFSYMKAGFPDYLIRNNSSEIRRCQQRIDELQRQRTTIAETARITAFEGGIEIERDADSNRLRISFPGKPAPAVINKLKQNGFKWSPTNMAWQRQLNTAAEYAAHQIIQFTQEKVS